MVGQSSPLLKDASLIGVKFSHFQKNVWNVPILSKILENHVAKPFIIYLHGSCLLDSNQSAYLS